MSLELPNAEAARKAKAGDRIAAVLRRQIVRGSLSTGASLPPEPALADHFQVSRPTIREALRILESEELITVQTGPGGGARVQELDPMVVIRHFGVLLQYRGITLADVYEARVHLELAAVDVLAASRTQDDLGRLAEALEASEPAQADPTAYTTHESAFSELLVELSGNRTMQIMAGMLYAVISVHYTSFGFEHSDAAGRRAARSAQRAHARLIELLRAGEPESARRLWGRHLDEVTRYVQSDLAKTVVEILN